MSAARPNRGRQRPRGRPLPPPTAPRRPLRGQPAAVDAWRPRQETSTCPHRQRGAAAGTGAAAVVGQVQIRAAPRGKRGVRPSGSTRGGTPSPWPPPAHEATNRGRGRAYTTRAPHAPSPAHTSPSGNSNGSARRGGDGLARRGWTRRSVGKWEAVPQHRGRRRFRSSAGTRPLCRGVPEPTLCPQGEVRAEAPAAAAAWLTGTRVGARRVPPPRRHACPPHAKEGLSAEAALSPQRGEAVLQLQDGPAGRCSHPHERLRLAVAKPCTDWTR